MSDELTRPILALSPDGKRYFADPGVLVARVNLQVSLYEGQTRAELTEWLPGQGLHGHLVWQHHIRTHNAADGASRAAARMLGQTGEWLSRQGWPGIAL